MLLFKGTKVCQRSTLNNRTLFKEAHLETLYSRLMKKTKLKLLLVKMGKGGNFKYNYDVYYNDD